MPELIRTAAQADAAQRRVPAYAGVAAAIMLAYLFVRDAGWISDAGFHSLLETVATVLAAVVGCLALVRYYSEKKTMFLFIGMGFVATTFLDGFHGVVSSAHFIQEFSDSSPSHISWSWTASRTYLSLLLWLSCLFWQREQRLGPAGKVADGEVYGIAAVLALACYAVIGLLPMPAAYFEDRLIPRLQDLLAALLFLLALLAYLRKGHWRVDYFEHWLVLSLIIGFMGQALFMATSREPHDAMFDGAHVLKIASYLCVMIGLLFNMHQLYKDSLARQELEFRNTILATQQELSRDAILVVDGHERIISWNSKFIALWGIPQAVMDARMDADVLKLVVAQMQDTQVDLARIRFLYAHTAEKSSEEVSLKDGRTIERYSAPMLAGDGTYYGRVWYFRDITERKQAERDVLMLKEQLREQSIHDPLTGLYNRRFLDETFGRELIRARRSGLGIGIVMCDLDFFKRVNDTWGHQAGDEVLKAFADLLTRNARGSDIVCRYGGEEFVVLLTDLPPNLARQRAEQLRIALEAMPIAFGDQVIYITASFGVSNFPEHGATQDELIQASDNAMYLAKTGGRNRVVIAPAPALPAPPQ